VLSSEIRDLQTKTEAQTSLMTSNWTACNRPIWRYTTKWMLSYQIH